MEWHSVKVGKIMEITDEEFKGIGGNAYFIKLDKAKKVVVKRALP